MQRVRFSVSTVIRGRHENWCTSISNRLYAAITQDFQKPRSERSRSEQTLHIIYMREKNQWGCRLHWVGFRARVVFREIQATYYKKEYQPRLMRIIATHCNDERRMRDFSIINIHSVPYLACFINDHHVSVLIQFYHVLSLQLQPPQLFPSPRSNVPSIRTCTFKHGIQRIKLHHLDAIVWETPETSI